MVRISDNFPGWNKAKRLSSVNRTTKTIHHHHHHHKVSYFRQLVYVVCRENRLPSFDLLVAIDTPKHIFKQLQVFTNEFSFHLNCIIRIIFEAANIAL